MIYRLCIVALIGIAQGLEAQTLPQWKFAKGKVIEYERIASQSQLVEIRGKPFKQQSQSTWHIRLEVQEATKDAWRVEAKLMKIEQRILGGTDAEMIDPKLHEKMQGSVFHLTVRPSGAIDQVEGHEDFLKRLSADKKNGLAALRATFPETAIKEMFADLFGPLPEKPVKANEVWTRDYLEPIPHFGALRSRAEFSNEGHNRIRYTVATKYELPKPQPGSLFKIVEGNIASEKAKGTIDFDRNAGRLIAHERSMRLRGTLTIETMNGRQAIEFTSQNEVRIRQK